MRIRKIISSSDRPYLPDHVHLQFDDLRDKWVVLAPESIFWPDDISLDILKLCDGKTSLDDVVNQLAQHYDAPAKVIEPDVVEFVQEWSDKLLLRVI